MDFSIWTFVLNLDASYKMIGGGGSGGLKQNEHYKRATADYQAANTQGTDVKKWIFIYSMNQIIKQSSISHIFYPLY